MPKGLLFMAFDFSTAHADEFHDWYDHEHVPERLRVPGFLNAERWIADDNPMVHVATYDLDSPAILISDALQGSRRRQPVGLDQTRNLDVPPHHALRRRTTNPRRAGRARRRRLPLLVASMTPDPDAEAEFNDWYDNEHLPNLSRVPGVISARRFRASDTESERKYLSLYHLQDLGVSRSDAWSAASNTPWTERMRPHLRDLLVIRMNRYQRKVQP